MHAHDFRDATESLTRPCYWWAPSYSAEDIAPPVSSSTGPSGSSAPGGPSPWDSNGQSPLRPLVQKFVGKTAHFKDGSELCEVDVVMFCTRYLHSYPFLRDELRLKSKNVLYPPNLYKAWSGWREAMTNFSTLGSRINTTPTPCLTLLVYG